MYFYHNLAGSGHVLSYFLETMCSLSDLPPEVVVIVVTHLEVKELAVSRRLNAIVENFCEQQFHLELQLAGYVQPRNSRTDISTIGKLSILRNNQERWMTHSPSAQIQNLELYGTYDYSGISSDDEEPVFYGGVLAHWNATDDTPTTSLKLDLVQLQSHNTGLSQKRWYIIEPMIPVTDYWFDQRQDLLVLLAVKHEVFEFHLRTLSKNESHPDAAHSGLLQLTARTVPSTGDLSLQFVGHFIFVHSPGNPGCIHGWDWTTGELQLDRQTGFGVSKDVVFLLDSVLVVPRLVSAIASTNPPVAVLDIYSLTSPSGVRLDMNIVATLKIVPPYTRPQHSDGPELALLYLQRSAGPIYQPSHSQRSTFRGPPAVFEPDDAKRLILLQFNYEKYSSDISSFLILPLESVQGAIETLGDQPGMHCQVAWEHWAAGTHWVYRLPVAYAISLGPTSQHMTSGTRMILPRIIENGIKDHWQREDLVLDILDLDKSFMESHQNTRLRLGPHDHNAMIDSWVYYSKEDLVNSVASAYDEWMGGASYTTAPYAMSTFVHRDTKGLAYQEYLITWTDEEHLLFLKRNELRMSCGIDVYTF
ncbi:vacuolar protein sorting-associated protein 13 [Ceratobasidium sp. AG-Ba]|nr:vacuolar protein sorting-associated protein 13 [Ceratobasidium sp. AG-Ba]